MSPCYAPYWAKTSPENAAAWLPFVRHAAAVALVAEEFLARSPATHHRLMSLCRLSKEGVVRLAGCLASLHDIGKLHVLFQVRSPTLFEQVYGGRYATLDEKRIDLVRLYGRMNGRDPTATYYHGEGGLVWAATQVAPNTTFLDPVAPFLRALGAHHGYYSVENRTALVDLANEFMHLQGALGGHFRQDLRAMHEFSEDVVNHYQPEDPGDDPDLDTACDILGGLISVADWIGSGAVTELAEEWEGRSFAEEMQDPQLRDLAIQGLDNHRLGQRALPRPGVVYPSHPLSHLQEKAKEVRGRLTIAEGPTAEGKTDFGLLAGREFLAHQLCDRVVVVGPTQASLNGMFPTYREFCQKVLDEDLWPTLCHAASEEYLRSRTRVPDGTPLPPEMKDEQEALQRIRWYRTGRRAFLAPVTLTTIDQLLMTGLKNSRHHLVRSLGLSGALVIIDEVHAVDTYMEGLLEHVLEHLARMGAHVILLSATLDPAWRQRLLESFSRGLGVEKKALPPRKKGFPLVTTLDAQGVLHQSACPPRLRSRGETTIRLLPCKLVRRGFLDSFDKEDFQAIVQDAIRSVEDGACVRWVRNSPADTQLLYDLVRKYRPSWAKEGKLLMAHASLRPVEQALVMEEITRRYGPEGQEQGLRRPALVIGTHLLEQSSNIDFDRSIRDMAPIANILQNHGRGHRFEFIVRPPGYEEDVLEVLFPVNYPEVSKDICRKIYQDAHLPLLRTWFWLQTHQTVQIPDDIPDLIEATFDPSMPSDTLLREAWDHDRRVTTERRSHASTSQSRKTQDHDPHPGPYPTRDGTFGRPFLFLVETPEEGVYRVSHTDVLVDLRPFEPLQGKKMREIRKELRGGSSLAWQALSEEVLAPHFCTRNALSMGHRIKVLKGERCLLLETLWKASRGVPKGLIPILLPSDNASALVSRWSSFETFFRIGYEPYVGLRLEKMG